MGCSMHVREFRIRITIKLYIQLKMVEKRTVGGSRECELKKKKKLHAGLLHVKEKYVARTIKN